MPPRAISAEELERDLRKGVSHAIEVVQEGTNRYVVHVPFTFADGDHFVILLDTSTQSVFRFTDEGHTFMHLSYDLIDFQHGTRRKVIDRVLARYEVADDQGALTLPVPLENLANGLFSFVQAITRVTDIDFLTREQVRSTFLEDVKTFVGEVAQRQHLSVTLDYVDQQHDPKGLYPVDAYLTNGRRPITVFAIADDTRCRDATITLHEWEKWRREFHPISIFRDLEEISGRVLARFTDIAEKQFSSLDSAHERFESYLGTLS